MKEIIIAFLSGSALTKLLDFLWKVIRSNKNNVFQAKLMAESKIHERLDKIVSATNVDRALILKLANGGGRPRVGDPVYTSITHERTSQRLGSIKNDYQKVEMDQPYCEMLRSVAQKKRVRLITQDMPAGDLKSIYIDAGIKEAVVILIQDQPTRFIYLEFHATQPLEITDHSAITLVGKQIAGIYRKGL